MQPLAGRLSLEEHRAVVLVVLGLPSRGGETIMRAEYNGVFKAKEKVCSNSDTLETLKI